MNSETIFMTDKFLDTLKNQQMIIITLGQCLIPDVSSTWFRVNSPDNKNPLMSYTFYYDEEKRINEQTMNLIKKLEAIKLSCLKLKSDSLENIKPEDVLAFIHKTYEHIHNQAVEIVNALQNVYGSLFLESEEIRKINNILNQMDVNEALRQFKLLPTRYACYLFTNMYVNFDYLVKSTEDYCININEIVGTDYMDLILNLSSKHLDELDTMIIEHSKKILSEQNN